MFPRRFSNSFFTSQSNLKITRTGDILKYTLGLRHTLSDKKIIEFLKQKFFHRSPYNGNSAIVFKQWSIKFRRFQQIFYVYSRLLEQNSLKDVLKKMRLHLMKKSNRFSHFALGAAGVSMFDWEKNRIPLEAIQEHSNDFEYVEKLKEATICLACDPTKPKESNPAVMCTCGKAVPDQTREFEGWMLFLETEELVIWRKPSNGQWEYKVYGSYMDISAEDFLNVQIDTEYRKKWDTTAVMLEIGETDPNTEANGDILYWEMLWPRLFVNRDYVFKRRFLIDKETSTLYIMSQTTEHSKYPKFPDKFRIENYWSCMAIRPHGNDMTKPGLMFCLTYYDDPGVNIPSSMQNWVARSAMPSFLERMRQATKEYKVFCVAEGTSSYCQRIKEEDRRQRAEDEKNKLDYCNYEWRKISLALADLYAKPPGYHQMSATEDARKVDKNSDQQQQQQHSSGSSNSGQSESNWKYFHPMYYFS